MTNDALDYYLQRVDEHTGHIRYEIHGAKEGGETFIVFRGDRAKEQSELCLKALEQKPVDVEGLKHSVELCVVRIGGGYEAVRGAKMAIDHLQERGMLAQGWRGDYPAEAIHQLKTHQDQLDMDGIMVGVSRQALDELFAALPYPPAEEKQ